MAFTTATLLIILVFVGIPLQLAAGRPEVVNDVGTIHGFLYLVYLVVAFELTRRLGVPKWQMVLVLLAGTVPFCAFVAERKLTRRFDALAGHSAEGTARRPAPARGGRARRRWLSRRALLLHLEVAIVAPGCVVAGWWQATRALAGNSLSWVYSVEWPIFALLAVAGWWHLVHEDPEAYRARRRASGDAREGAPAGGSPAPSAMLGRDRELTVERTTARLATTLALLVGAEFLLGVGALILVPFGRPSGGLPTKGTAIYLAHAIIGVPLALGAVALLTRVRRSTRISRLSGWVGGAGVAVAGAGGLLTLAHPLRLAGMACMLVGPVVAAFGYLFPTFERLPDRAPLAGER